jgi:hypothetical protein
MPSGLYAPISTINATISSTAAMKAAAARSDISHISESPARPPPSTELFTLTQLGDVPGRLARSRCFETIPSRPNSHALQNRSGPISPCSNGAVKMPSGRRASRRRT